VLIEVHDRGIGIPGAEAGRIGRRFFRASNAKASAGTGLGLYAAHRFLAYHGGTLRLASKAGEGTSAIVRLPSSREASGANSPGETTA
jgi:signal transduction histidine kinase